MATRLIFKAGVILLATAGIVSAQSSAEQVQAIKRQMEQLQEQLHKLEHPEKPNKGVTQIGTARKNNPRDTAMVVRLYDVSDLFATAPPYAARAFDDLGIPGGQRSLFPSAAGEQGTSSGGMGGGGFGGGGGGFFAVTENAAKLPPATVSVLAQKAQPAESKTPEGRTSLQNLIEAITSTIAPQSWDEVGGPGSIAPIGNALLISNEESVHEQIEALLDLFRKRWGTLRTVSVRAYWVWLNDQQLGELVSEDGPVKNDSVQAYGLVDDAAWKKLMAARQAPDSDAPGGFRAIITCYNGQTVHTAAGGQKLAVVDVTPENVQVTGKDETQIGYHATTSVIQDGAALQVTPLVNTSGKYVVLDIHSRVAKPATDDERPRPAEAGKGQVRPQELVRALDRPQIQSQRLSTTLRVPVDRTALVGGMTFDSEPGPGDPSLYLFVRVSVQELRDDRPTLKVGQDGPATDAAPPSKSNDGEQAAEESPFEQ